MLRSARCERSRSGRGGKPDEFRDEYREKLEALIEAKAEGGPIKLRKLRPRKPPESLSGALEKSLAEARKKPRKAAGGTGRG